METANPSVVGPIVNIAQALSLAIDSAQSSEPIATLHGIIVCTMQFSYRVAELDDCIGVLLHSGVPSITDRLLQCAPPPGGSHIIYPDQCEIKGVLSDCVLLMFPRGLHSITALVFDGHQIIADGDNWRADPPLF
jgi:hypothetical protein